MAGTTDVGPHAAELLGDLGSADGREAIRGCSIGADSVAPGAAPARDAS